MTKEINEQNKVSFATHFTDRAVTYNPWRDSKHTSRKDWTVDKNYDKIVESCREFYRTDPIANTTIDKLTEIGITDIVIDKGTLSDNQHRALLGLIPEILDFIEQGALEYLLSGLLVPEITWGWKKKRELEKMGVKKYSKLYLPKEMWFRNPDNIEIKPSFFSRKPEYYLKFPDEFIRHLRSLENVDKISDSDSKLLNELRTTYPGFYEKLKSMASGGFKVLLDNTFIFRRKPLIDSPYPTPYLLPALNPLRHKKNLRAMDYALASRVIEAIQIFTLGNDEYPLTEETQLQLDELKAQIENRQYTSTNAVEKVYQLFSNHTLHVEWVIPDLEALLNAEKYSEVNEDILFSLGFPRILITGETKRTGSSEPDFAVLSPIATMKSFRKKLLRIIQHIFDEVVEKNSLGDYGGVRFSNINLTKFEEFSTTLLEAASKGKVAGQSVSEYFGYNWAEEQRKRKEEKDLLDKLGLDVYDEQPFDKKSMENEQENTKETKDDKEK